MILFQVIEILIKIFPIYTDPSVKPLANLFAIPMAILAARLFEVRAAVAAFHHHHSLWKEPEKSRYRV